MKALVGMIAFLSAGLISAQALALASDAHVTACNRISLAGKFQSTPDLQGKIHKFKIKQDGCSVEVRETWIGGKQLKRLAVWKFDLSGKQEFKLPGSVLLDNKNSDLGYPSLSSFVGTSSLDQRIGSIATEIRMTIPATAETQVESVVNISGDINIHCLNDPCKVNYIDFDVRKVRLTSANYYGPVGSAFVSGANYVLKFLDDMNYIGMIAPQMQSIQRVD